MDPYWYALACIVIGAILGVVVPYLFKVIYAISDMFKIKKNTANATVATAQVNITYDTYDMSVITLGAGDDFTIWYKSNLNIIS